jgi:hypothetical protein
VVVHEAPELEGDQLGFVALADGRVLPSEADVLARALDPSLARPYRAEAVRRDGAVWAAGAVGIDVRQLDLGAAGELEIVVQAGESPPFPIGERPPFVLRAQRLVDDLWEIETTPL